MGRFTADDFLRVLREDPDMPTEALAARMELTDANLYYHARRHGGVAALRERARVQTGALPVAAPPAPAAAPDPVPPVDAPAESVDEPRPAVDGGGPTPAETRADELLPAGAMQGAEMMASLADPGEAPAEVPPAAEGAGYNLVFRGLQQEHGVSGRMSIRSLGRVLDGISVLVGDGAVVEAGVRATWRPWWLAWLPRTLGWRTHGGTSGIRVRRTLGWTHKHEIWGEMPLGELADLLVGLSNILGPGARVDAKVTATRRVSGK